MSRADNREHLLSRLALVVAAFSVGATACGVDAPAPGERLPSDLGAAIVRVRALAADCAGLERALDSITASGFSGRGLIALVDAASAAACVDPLNASRGTSAARALARSRFAASDVAALAELPASIEPALALRRAELFDRTNRPVDAYREISIAIALAPDPDALAQFRLLGVAAAAQRTHITGIARLVASAPIEQRPRLAHRAALEVQPELLSELADGGPELAAAAADRLEERDGPAAAIRARERLVELAPDDADAWDALARSRLANVRVDDALAAWDRAIVIAPGQMAFRIAPIEALAKFKNTLLAQRRAGALAAEARSSRNVELLIAASAGAAFVDHALALALAREAHELRPSDGRIAFLVAQRLVEAGDKARAARAYADLLVCGAHGRAWHRHEVAAKLQQLGTLAAAALAARRSCEPVESGDLASYLESLGAIR